MNDVSILFPLPSTGAEISTLLGPSSSGARGALLPAQLYASPAVGPISGSSPPGDASVPFLSPPFGVAAYSDLHVVAMRIDPCFASLSPDPHGVGCAAQIRLVFQEVRVAEGEDGGVSAFDSALHAFYSLTRDEFLSLARALVALRAANQGAVMLGPLAPHPIMAAQGLSGPMATGVTSLILQYAGEQNLVRAAQLSGASAIIDEWSLSAVNVTNATTAATSPFAIPSLSIADGGAQSSMTDDAGGVIAQTTNAAFGSPVAMPDAGPQHFAAGFTPATTNAENFAPLDQGTTLGNLNAPELQSALNALAQVENPADNSPATIDCASCHFATPTEAFIGLPLFSFDDTTSPLSFKPDGKSVMPADMTATFPGKVAIPFTEVSIHAFSYFGGHASINQRVVNETAAVVEYLNNLPE